jgi:arginase family enzyme
MDSLDPSRARCWHAGFWWLTAREAHLLMEMLADDGRVRSLDLVSQSHSR